MTSPVRKWWGMNRRKGAAGTVVNQVFTRNRREPAFVIAYCVARCG